jgi:uncharacterized protein (TIGR03085 family)
VSSISRRERAALADLLERLGPDAPTLCAGWDTRALAAHLVVRERRMDAAPGIVVRSLAGHTEAVQEGYATRPYDELVRLVRSGPPRWSPFALPKVEPLLNTTEYFVHHEDVRRAQQGWAPRELPPKVQDALWRVVQTRAPVALRQAACGVVLQRPGGASVTAKAGSPTAVLTGEPAELLLYLFGRGAHAQVEVGGPEAAQEALRRTSLAV